MTGWKSREVPVDILHQLNDGTLILYLINKVEFDPEKGYKKTDELSIKKNIVKSGIDTYAVPTIIITGNISSKKYCLRIKINSVPENLIDYFECNGGKCRHNVKRSFDAWCVSCHGDPESDPDGVFEDGKHYKLERIGSILDALCSLNCYSYDYDDNVKSCSLEKFMQNIGSKSEIEIIECYESDIDRGTIIKKINDNITTIRNNIRIQTERLVEYEKELEILTSNCF